MQCRRYILEHVPHSTSNRRRYKNFLDLAEENSHILLQSVTEFCCLLQELHSFFPETFYRYFSTALYGWDPWSPSYLIGCFLCQHPVEAQKNR